VFAALSIVIPLSNPDLRDKLGIDRRQGCVEGSRIEVPVYGCRKKDQRGSLGRLDLQLLLAIVVLASLMPRQLRKGRVPTAGHVVQVNQDGHGSLSPVGRKACPISLVDVKGIVVGKVLLGVQIASHLREFHVADWLSRQLGDLAAQSREILPRQVAGGRRSCLADDPCTGTDDGGGCKGIGGNRNQVVALFHGEKVVDFEKRRIVVDLLEARIKGIDAVEDGDGSSMLLLLLLRLLLGRIVPPRIMSVCLLRLLRKHGFGIDDWQNVLGELENEERDTGTEPR